MQRKQLTCPKCGTWRLERHNQGSEYEEIHCQVCGFIAYIGLARKARAASSQSGAGRRQALDSASGGSMTSRAESTRRNDPTSTRASAMASLSMICASANVTGAPS